jgi:hypothetical protein
MDNPQVTKKLAWLAGIIDGEGTITIRRNGRNGGHNRKGDWKIMLLRPEISIANTNPLLINACSEILKENEIGHNIQEIEGKENRKTYWIIHTAGFQRCKKMLDLIIEYLVGKLPQAELMNKFYETRIAKRGLSVEKRRYTKDDLRIANKIRNLNDYTWNSQGKLKIPQR